MAVLTEESIHALRERAFSQHDGRDLDAAERSYREVLQHTPDDIEIVHALGILMVQTGRFGEAAELLSRVLRARESAQAHADLGNALCGLSRFDEAVLSYGRALALQPNLVEAHINRGVARRDGGRADAALADYDAALALQPGNVEALCNRAAALSDLGRFEEALEACDRALSYQPNRAEIPSYRATMLLRLERYQEALMGYDRAIGLRPDYAEAHAGRGAALQYLRRSAEALASCDHAIALAPGLASAHFNRGSALRDLLRIDESLRSFETARSLQPEDPETNCNLGGLLLQTGRFDLGWELYEWRSRMPGAPQVHRYPQPRWDGQADLSGKTLFTYLDQGMGDTIQFVRYAKLAEMRGAHVVMAVQDNLRRLMSSLSPTIRVLGQMESPDTFDYHCPLASLPRMFGTTLDTIPADVPYLSAEPGRIAQWRARLGTGGFKIGICWQGSALKSGIGRSFPPSEFRRIAAIPRVRLISLQQGIGEEQMRALCPGMPIETLGEGFDAGPDAFRDTAAVMESLDLVISCDTATAHVAGALGRPAWVLLKRVPDWRWLFDGDDNPWYPTIRVFRQEVDGRWDEVFDAVHRELSGRVNFGT